VSAADVHIRVRPATGWEGLAVRELWEYRELAYFLVWRDLKVRYKQTVLGVGWAALQPLVTVVIFSVVFGRLADLPSDTVPYPVFTLTALLPWQLFSSAFANAANSVVGSANLVSKVYFPRLIVPIASVLTTLVDFGVWIVLLAALMIWYRVTPTVNIVWLPLLTLVALGVAFGVGLWVAALNVRYRDVRYVLPFVLQAWLFATPVAYSLELVPPQWRLLYGLNPLVGVVQGFRWALLASAAPGPLLLVTIAMSALLIAFGAYYFRRTEDHFADLI
jgi:homopolymeric O-antigen transport system permease protein